MGTRTITKDQYLAKIKALEEQVENLEKGIIRPKYQPGDIAMYDGYRKVEILEVIYKEKSHLFKSSTFNFVYRCRFLQTEPIIENNHVYHFSKCDVFFNQEELSDVPVCYETYLVHMIYKLRSTEKELK